MAIASALTATALRVYIGPLIGYKAPFLFNAIAIAVSAQYGGTLPGLLSTILGFVLAYLLFVVPGKGAHIPDAPDIAGLLVVLGVGIFLSVFFGRRRSAEAEVLRMYHNLETAQHIASVGSWESDLATGRLWWSAETRKIFGVEAAAPVSAEEFYRLVHPADRESVGKLESLAITSKQRYEVEHRIVRDTGEIRHVHQIANVLCNNKGVPKLMVGSIQDITERKRAEQEIRTLQGLLPICANCKKIRDDQAGGTWSEVESYVKHHSEATFTHTICPTCIVQLYGPEMTKDSSGMTT